MKNTQNADQKLLDKYKKDYPPYHINEKPEPVFKNIMEDIYWIDCFGNFSINQYSLTFNPK